VDTVYSHSASYSIGPLPVDIINQLFTALLGMQTRSSDENSVCPSVCQTRNLWQNGRKISPDYYTIRKTICL